MTTKKTGTSPLKIVDLQVDAIVPNPWNVNRMSDEMQAKLTAYLKAQGLVEPLVVRPKGANLWELLGGFHRWKICKEKLGYKTVPCVVVELDDKKAKILSVNLNEMKGQSVPSLLAELLHDLNKEIDLDDLATLLPYSAKEMEDSLALLKLPEGLDALLEEEARKEEAAAPVIVSIVFSKLQNEVFEAALEKAVKETGDSKNKRGRAVELMARAYLQAAPEAVPGAMEAPEDE